MTLTSDPRKRTKYNEIMERIQVTPEMHERIMSRIRAMDIQKEQAPSNKPPLWTRYRKYIVTAASLMVVLAGVLVAQHGFAPGMGPTSATTQNSTPESKTAPESDMMSPYSSSGAANDRTMRSMTVPSSMTYASLAELDDAAGYKVKQIEAVPFQADQTQYSLTDQMAEIRYTGSTNDLTFRMQPGSGDISGDYTEYSRTQTITNNGTSITVKGNDKGYNLAVWEQDGYTYSILLQQPLSSDKLLEVIRSVK